MEVSLRVGGKGWRFFLCAPSPGGRTRVAGRESLGAVECVREFRTWRSFSREKMEAVIFLSSPFPPLLML